MTIIGGVVYKKIWGLIFNINIDNPATFREVNMPTSCVSKDRFFRDFDSDAIKLPKREDAINR